MPKHVRVRLRLEEFCTSAERLAWDKANGCPWDEWASETVARGGHLEGLRWAREHECPWNAATVCAYAAEGGHLEVVQWAREHGCELNAMTCAGAACGGHLEVLQWARAHGCPWTESTCEHTPLLAGTWMCCSGHGSTTARGIRASAPLKAGT